ncbi:hypothetical protein AAG906_008248 [Vitis piasezkii]|eukprot:XP_010658254.1 PREDICTED: RING-H2 finger protein ATL66 [Vitis vinifera]
MSSQDTSHLRWRYTEFDDQSFEIRGRTLFFIIVLFSFILIITLLFLYARWVCRYNRQVPATSVRPAPTPPPPQGLDPAIISSLPIVLHQQSPSPAGSSIEDCCICLGIFQEGDKVKILPQCHHYYHSECVDRWLGTHTSCPLCRASVRVHSLP